MSLILVVEETEKDSNEYTGVLTRYYTYGTDRKDEKKFGWKMGILNDGRKHFSLYLDKVETNIKRDMNTDTYNQKIFFVPWISSEGCDCRRRLSW